MALISVELAAEGFVEKNNGAGARKRDSRKGTREQARSLLRNIFVNPSRIKKLAFIHSLFWQEKNLLLLKLFAFDAGSGSAHLDKNFFKNSLLIQRPL